MLSPSSALVGSGLGAKVALVTDGRFSGATHGKLVDITNSSLTSNTLYTHKV